MSRQATQQEMYEVRPGPGRPCYPGLHSPLEATFPLCRTLATVGCPPRLFGTISPRGCLVFPGTSSSPLPTHPSLARISSALTTRQHGCHLRIGTSRVVVSCTACLWRCSSLREPEKELCITQESTCMGLLPAWWGVALAAICGGPGSTITDALTWGRSTTKRVLDAMPRSMYASRAARGGAFGLQVRENLNRDWSTSPPTPAQETKDA